MVQVDDKLILITLLVELGVAASFAAILARSTTFKNLLLQQHRSLRQTVELLALICVPLTLGVWIRVGVPNFLAADISFEADDIAGVIVGAGCGDDGRSVPGAAGGAAP